MLSFLIYNSPWIIVLGKKGSYYISISFFADYLFVCALLLFCCHFRCLAHVQVKITCIHVYFIPLPLMLHFQFKIMVGCNLDISQAKEPSNTWLVIKMAVMSKKNTLYPILSDWNREIEKFLCKSPLVGYITSVLHGDGFLLYSSNPQMYPKIE